MKREAWADVRKGLKGPAPKGPVHMGLQGPVGSPVKQPLKGWGAPPHKWQPLWGFSGGSGA